MAGKIVADQIEGTTTTETVDGASVTIPNVIDTKYVVNGSAKAWINLNGTGTIARRDSLNISGISDGGDGLTDVSLISAMGNNDYAALASGSFNDTASGSTSISTGCRSLATSSVRITMAGSSNNGLDCETVTMTIHGDFP